MDHKIKAKNSDTGEKVEMTVTLPDTLEEAVNELGEEVVLSNFLVGAGKQAQNKLYSLLNASKLSAEKAEEEMANWKPFEAGRKTGGGRASAEDVVARKFAAMSNEERQAFLQKLQEMAQ